MLQCQRAVVLLEGCSQQEDLRRAIFKRRVLVLNYVFWVSDTIAPLCWPLCCWRWCENVSGCGVVVVRGGHCNGWWWWWWWLVRVRIVLTHEQLDSNSVQ